MHPLTLLPHHLPLPCPELGIIRSVGEAAEAAGVSINSVLQNPIVNYDRLDFVICTEEVSLSQIQKFTERINKASWSLQTPLFMPILV